MCGIVGILSAYQNGFSTTEVDTFKNMLHVNALRGDDSTGVFLVQNNDTVQVAKEASNVCKFMDNYEAKGIMHDAMMTGMYMIGHNRAATRGAVVDANAHPFIVEDRIILVQNGTWLGDHKYVKNTECDSEAVAHIIAEATDIPSALKQINASYALVWYDVSKKELYLIRNQERPLYVCRTEDEGMVFASEASFITFAAARAGLKLKETPYMLIEDNLVTVKRKDESWTLTNTKMSTKYVAPKAAPPTSTSTTSGTTTTTVVDIVNEGAKAIKEATQQLLGFTHGSRKENKTKDYNIHAHVHSGAFSDWHTDEQTARMEQSEYASNKTPVYLEMVDYVQGEPGTKPKCWHAIFAEVGGDKVHPGPLFWHTFRDGKAKMLELIEQPFRIATVGSPVIHVLTMPAGKREFVTVIQVRQFVDDAKVIDAKETTQALH